MKRYDLQVHTDASPCSQATPESIVTAATKANLDGIAVTDHDTLEGYEAVKAMAPEKLQVIPGVEVTTTQGHILALDVEKEPPQANPLTVAENIRSQGGVAILSHPFDRLREHFTESLPELAQYVHGVEVVNSRCVFSTYNSRALSYAQQHNLATTGGSDAHFPMELGRAYTLADRPILEAIKSGETQSTGKGGYISGHIATKSYDLLSVVKSL